MKDKNPVDSIHFFNTPSDRVPISIPKERVSLLIPTEFSEKCIRIYCRDPDLVCIIFLIMTTLFLVVTNFN